MTLKFFDGWEQDDNGKWASGVNVFGSLGRRGTNGQVHVQPTASLISKDLLGGGTEAIIGFSYNYNIAVPTGVQTAQLCALGDNTVWHACAWYDAASGTIKISLGGAAGAGALLATSSAVSWVVNTSYYIEFRVKVDNATGQVELRRDGVSIASATGIDTQNGGTTALNRVLLGGAGTAATMNVVYDDFYALDTAGAVNNTFLGDRRVTVLRPTGAGSSTQFTPSAGANWSVVDDGTGNGDTDYVESATIGHLDLYAMANLGFSPTIINGVQFTLDAKRTDGVARVIKPKIRQAGTNYDWLSNVTLTDAYVKTVQIRETNPATSAAFIASDIDAIEAGVEVVS